MINNIKRKKNEWIEKWEKRNEYWKKNEKRNERNKLKWEWNWWIIKLK